MQVIKFDTHEEWLSKRDCKITGSKLKDIVVKRGNERKIGFYKLIAERLGYPDDSIDGIDRGHELEAEAIAALSSLVDIDFETDLVMWQSDENPNMAYSPDGYTRDLTITAEAKCLGSARHIKIIVENKIPNDYVEQMIQSFIVNEKQQTHYFVSYDPRITAKPAHYIVTHRADVVDQIESLRQYQKQVLADVDSIVEALAF